MTAPPVRIATRASRLALWQAEHVAGLLSAAEPGRQVELVEVATTGDTSLNEPLAAFGGVGVFTREVQRAVLEGRADLAVHSLKDLPTEEVAGLSLAAVPPRGPRFDVLVLPAGSPPPAGLDVIPHGARIGTGSIRRQAQLRALRPDLALADVRGNVETRLRKLDEGEYDALVLAEAGLRRLGLASRISLMLEPPLMFPAVGQGALGLECRADDRATGALLATISDPSTHLAVLAERALLAALRGGCHAPIGVDAWFDGARIVLAAVVLSADGARRVEVRCDGAATDPVALGRETARRLLDRGAANLLDPDQAQEPAPEV
ncbi:MAG: hydroxymethylbilane synthase [Planctomycetaceae bacterium]